MTQDKQALRLGLHNQSTPELSEKFKELPSIEDSKEYLKLRMMQVTELASQMLCIDQGNLKLMDFLQKQIPATYRLLQEDSTVENVDTSAGQLDFSLESADSYVSKDDLGEYL